MALLPVTLILPSAVHFLDRFDFAAGRRNFRGNFIERVFGGIFFAGQI
jgi:hypothetical protein